jgi:hypothetical protein
MYSVTGRLSRRWSFGAAGHISGIDCLRTPGDRAQHRDAVRGVDDPE